MTRLIDTANTIKASTGMQASATAQSQSRVPLCGAGAVLTVGPWTRRDGAADSLPNQVLQLASEPTPAVCRS